MLPGKNNSLKMVAEELASRGIAALRYDKRGVAQSVQAGMAEADLRFEHYVDDAIGWGQQLQQDPRFSALFVAGHSEGSLIGLKAAQNLETAGFISIAGSGRPASEVLTETTPIPTLTRFDATGRIYHPEPASGKYGISNVPPALNTLFRSSIQPYLISWFAYDPATELGNLNIPALIVQGTTDIQISVADAERLAEASPKAELLIIRGMNHVLKDVTGDRMQQIPSYGNPDLPVNTFLIDEMSRFIQAHL